MAVLGHGSLSWPALERLLGRTISCWAEVITANVSISSTGLTVKVNSRAYNTRASVNEDEILEILRPMFKRYALERHDGGTSVIEIR